MGKLSKAEVARELGVSRATVSAWATALKAGGVRCLRCRKAGGRKSKLNGEQRQKLKRLLGRGALASGFLTERWTLGRVCELIKREFGVSYHPNSLNHFLKKLGFLSLIHI